MKYVLLAYIFVTFTFLVMTIFYILKDYLKEKHCIHTKLHKVDGKSPLVLKIILLDDQSLCVPKSQDLTLRENLEPQPQLLSLCH